MRVKFMFDYGASDSCMWNVDSKDEKYYGSIMSLDNFPISDRLKLSIIKLCEEYQTSLDWEYPPNPSPWTKEHKRDFAQRAKEAYDLTVKELGDEYEVINRLDLCL